MKNKILTIIALLIFNQINAQTIDDLYGKAPLTINTQILNKNLTQLNSYFSFGVSYEAFIDDVSNYWENGIGGFVRFEKDLKSNSSFLFDLGYISSKGKKINLDLKSLGFDLNLKSPNFALIPITIGRKIKTEYFGLALNVGAMNYAFESSNKIISKFLFYPNINHRIDRIDLDIGDHITFSDSKAYHSISFGINYQLNNRNASNNKPKVKMKDYEQF